MRNSKLLLLLGFVVMLTSVLGVNAQPNQTFTAHLTSDQEVPPNESDATGQAIFRLSNDGTELHYQLIVANIENVFASHIHLAPAGQNGPVVAFLFGSVPPGGGASNGVLAEGTITSDDVIGVLAGSLSDLVEQMEAGNTYVNVHTNDGVGDPNTGPGDIASGEIRGQIR